MSKEILHCVCGHSEDTHIDNEGHCSQCVGCKEFEGVPNCYFCDRAGEEERSFPVAEDPQDAEAGGVRGKHWLCWQHLADLDNREGIFDPFAFLE